MSKATANFTEDDIAKVNAAESMEAAQNVLHSIIDQAAGTKYAIKPEKVAVLHRNVNAARNKAEVQAIVYNMYLSGEGLATMSSKYQRRYA